MKRAATYVVEGVSSEMALSREVLRVEPQPDQRAAAKRSSER